MPHASQANPGARTSVRPQARNQRRCSLPTLIRAWLSRDHWQWLSLRGACLLMACLLCLGAAAPAAADVFLLASGGQLRGRWINRDEKPLVAYQIELAGGGQLTLDRDQVRQAMFERPERQEYDRRVTEHADTVEDHWKLAEWCREHTLPAERNAHLERILELDSEHQPARQALGFAKQGDRWVTTRELRKEIGLQYYRGKWRLAQEIELIERRSKRKLAEKEWIVRLKKLREALSGERAEWAYKSIKEINDPHALPALTQLYVAERYRNVKLLYVEVFGQIGGGDASKLLIALSLNDQDEEVRYACVEQIVRLRPPGDVKTYIAALKDANNLRVNRAAFALAELGDKSAIEALINALVTRHSVTYTPPGASADAISSSFSTGPESSRSGPLGPSSGSGLSTGSGAQTRVYDVPNQQVLSALVRLTDGTSFNFDRASWNNWYSAYKNRSTDLNARRE